MFGENFHRSLVDTVRSGQLPNDIGEIHENHHQSSGIKSERLREFIHRFNRITLTWMCQLCRVNFLGDYDLVTSRSKRLTARDKLSLLRLDAIGRSSTTKRKWPHVILAIYSLCVIVLLVNIYYQYKYNVNMAKLDKIDQLNATGELSLLHQYHHHYEHQLDWHKLRHEFQQRAREAHTRLKWMGASHIEWAFIIQSILLVFIISTTNLYVLLPLNQRLNKWLLLGPRLILGADNEIKVRTRLIEEELNKFSINSLAMARWRMEQSSLCLAKISSSLANVNSSNSWVHLSDKALMISKKHIHELHRRTMHLLRTIALEGRLNPLNRTQAARDRLDRVCLQTIVSVTLLTDVVVIMRYRYLSKYFNLIGLHYELDSLLDFFNAICIVFVFLIHSCMVIFWGVTLIITWFDQMETVRLLRVLILRVVRRNEQRLSRLLVLSSGMAQESDTSGALQSVTASRPMRIRHQSYARPTLSQAQILAHRTASFRRQHPQLIVDRIRLRQEMDRDLLTLTIQCRLVTRTLELTKNPLSQFACAAVTFAVVMLVVFRLHGPYFHPGLRSVNIAISITCIACSFIFVTPHGRLHQQSILTFKELWNLVAQISLLETMPTINKWLQLDSSVAVFSLRRELADSKFRMGRLACEVAGLSITRQNLTKAAFWALLFILSLSGNINLFGEGFSDFMNDPFGLFHFAGT